MEHYTYEQLEQLRSGGIHWMRRLICRIHIRHCSSCRRLASGFENDNRLIQKVRLALNEMSAARLESRER